MSHALPGRAAPESIGGNLTSVGVNPESSPHKKSTRNTVSFRIQIFLFSKLKGQSHKNLI
jgi:hypothetical protein